MLRRSTRRGVLAVAAASAATALSSSVARPTAVAEEVPPKARARWASEFGAVGDGLVDDTDALSDGLRWATNARAALLLDPGFYAVTALELRDQATLRSVAGGGSRFAPGGRHAPAVLVPLLGRKSDQPMVTISGTGVHLEGVGVSGYNFRQGGDPDAPVSWMRTPGIVVGGGIEVVLADVRVFRVANTGIRVEQLNNARWRDVFVDDCGTESLPAMRIESVGSTNFVHFDGLTIERSANRALDIATGTDPVRDWASNLVFSALHIESNADGASQHGLNTEPLVDVGNVRAVTFLAPQLLGRPAPLIRYRQQIPPNVELPSSPGGDARDQQGGLQIVAGHLKQHGGGDAARRVASIEVSGNGRGLAVFGTKFASMWCPGVLVRPDYQHDLVVSGNTFRRAGAQAGNPASVHDERSAVVQRSTATDLHGWHSVRGGSLSLDDGSLYVQRGAVHVAGEGLVVKAAATDSKVSVSSAPGTAGGWVSPSQGAGTDNAGRVWCRVDASVEGKLFTVTFERARDEAPIVSLTARSAAAARAQVWVEPQHDVGGTVTGFAVFAGQPLDASAEVLPFDYFVVGRER